MIETTNDEVVKGGGWTGSNSGPGPQELIGYYETPGNPARHHGFFGEVHHSEFIDGLTLSSVVGLESVGVPQNSTTSWLKFLIDGKIVFVPKLPLRHSITWQDIYQAGCVYADNTVGLYPSGPLVLQNKRVSVRGYQFKVGLLSGSNVDPCPNVTGYDLPITHGSEWNRLFHSILQNNPSHPKTSQEGPKWWNYTEAELGITSGYGRYTWCRESHAYGPNYHVIRGYLSVAYLDRNFVTSVATSFGWRPRLELIQG